MSGTWARRDAVAPEARGAPGTGAEGSGGGGAAEDGCAGGWDEGGAGNDAGTDFGGAVPGGGSATGFPESLFASRTMLVTTRPAPSSAAVDRITGLIRGKEISRTENPLPSREMRTMRPPKTNRMIEAEVGMISPRCVTTLRGPARL
ncbi:hypothetical protein B7P34_22000 [Streptosporangium nondiastaticum]|uniref:Uncharacterized protein n=1 Tax=Streptosporangium nondiastaticum TaxID=35764 RepID=A0A9X7PG45_9ACTN|nr:hypothetical protein B7P34_22000 [Streptosporangium nondiastaticum]